MLSRYLDFRSLNKFARVWTDGPNSSKTLLRAHEIASESEVPNEMNTVELPTSLDITPGVIPVLTSEVMEKYTSKTKPSVSAWDAKIPLFESAFIDVPPAGNPGNLDAIEHNARLVYNYALDCIVATGYAKPSNYISQYGIDVFTDANEKYRYTVGLEALKFVCNRQRVMKGLFPAISASVGRTKKSIDMLDLGYSNLSTADRIEIQGLNMQIKISNKLNAEVTQRTSYIDNTTAKQRILDDEAYCEHIEKMSTGVLGIVNCTIDDMPYSYYQKEAADFARDQRNPAHKIAIRNKLKEFKNEAFGAWREDKTGFCFRNWISVRFY
jgi:hypothetical protein